jgi:hypothetical protein
VNDSKLRIIVTGLIAQYPLGGVAWDYLQYVVGLARLGHDVYYVEDTGQWPYNPNEAGTGKSCDFNVNHLRHTLGRFGLEDRFAYRFPWGPTWHGLPDDKRDEVIATADLVINVSGVLYRPDEYRAAKRMAYIDSDPMFTQLKMAKGQHDLIKAVDLHDVYFTFGECLSDRVPDTGHHWQPTRQPVLLDQWSMAEPTRDAYTTIMNWTSYKDIEFNGQSYGQKDRQMLEMIGLPEKVAPVRLELAIASGKTRRTPVGKLTAHGWHIVDPDKACGDVDSYRDYIQTSRGEWSVAKHGYVAGRTGWFSCRSACYLAAGRPVVVQDTGFSSVLPIGEGVLVFDTIDQAAEAICMIESDYDRHCRAARGFAEEYFDAGRVLGSLVERAMSDTQPITRAKGAEA